MAPPNSDRASGSPPGAASSERRPPAGHPRVLLVVPDPDLRERARSALADGRAVEALADARTALRSALESAPDVVVADAAAAPELLGALRADPRTQGVPIVLMTARTGTEGAA